ncbi:MAG TPA: cation transporter [Terriglobales bacterium]|jgi:divalent metal cation (Fe/Co/Zn/Cd) transporter|nr:cation transporter [Terriglobales bacterium]
MADTSPHSNSITQLPDYTITRSAAARGRRLEYFTIAWNSAEAIAALVAGVLAGSIALVGFGLDSVIEISSGAVLLWRLRAENDAERRERAERRAHRLVGICFLALAAYVAYDSIKGVVRHEAPQESIFGICVAIASLIAMPLLARAKRQVARQLNSGAMRADSRQTDFCAYLSAILLAGLLLNALLGWWWADPAAALVMVPLIAREGVEGLRAKRCCD